MSSRVCVIDLPGLSRELLGAVPANSSLGKWLSGQRVVGMTPSWPAVTCSVQATLTTGVLPSQHGIIANGLPTFRSASDQALVDASNFAAYRKQISFWEQSNQFVEAPRFWQQADGRSKWKTALLFFQNSMPGFSGTPKPAADIVLTPKPDHGPDGKIVSLCWSEPRDLVPALFKELGPFPLMNYWGPMAGIASSAWIAKAAAQVWKMYQPQLQLVYVPHLDYDLQRFGPSSPQATKAVADVAAAIEPLLDAVLGDKGKVVLLSEYAMRGVNRCIYPNRLLAEAGMLQTVASSDGQLIDYQKSRAVAMVDHQIAHIYTQAEPDADAALEVLGRGGLVLQAAAVHDARHRRCGDLMMAAPPGAWLDYRWWSDAALAPSFAGMVDIHRKPGYDPLELFWEPSTKKISDKPELIRGSHGIVEAGEALFAGGPAASSGNILASEAAGLIARLVESV